MDSETNDPTTPQKPNDEQLKSEAVGLPLSLKVRLEMKSDWHVGTGMGRPGSVDKLIARDADGFPFVPAKTLNGIWRDALETLTRGLDSGGKDEKGQPKYEWQKFVEVIFGNQPALPGAASPTIKPRPSILQVQPARLSQNLRAITDEAVSHITGKEERQRQRRKLLSALTFIKPGVAIDEKTGTSKPDFLRFEEMGRVGTILEADCELRYYDETIRALLVSSARLVERIGGKRRRGAGRCELKVYDKDGNEIPLVQAIQHLRSFKDAPQGPDIEKESPPDIDLVATNATGEWQHLEFSLTLQTPVSIVTATLGNVSESLDFIPGTYLLPHFTKVLGKRLGKEFFTAVAYGDFQISPATIEINGERSLPVPKVLVQEKVGGGFNKSNTIYNKLTDDLKKARQPKPLRSGYVQALDSATEITDSRGTLPSYKNEPKTLLMHNAIEDKYQRPTTDVGGVYSREAIAAGAILRGEIRLRKKLAEDLRPSLGAEWWKIFDGDTVRLGTSRKDDYGLAKLKVWLKAAKDEKDEDENDYLQKNPVKDSNPKLTVYLESDVLLRNETLRQTNLIEDLAKELSKEDKLCVSLKPIEPTADETTSLVQTRRIESWHEGWGFPRPTLIAMAAGSCVVFEVMNGSLDLAALKKLEVEGIGERRGEGYGQVRFNPPLLTNRINAWEAATKPNELEPQANGATSELSAEEKAFLRLIEDIAWREELKLAVLKVADEPGNRKEIFGFDSNEKDKPPMSQIGGLRSVIRRLQDEKGKAIVLNWLKHLKATPNRREKWPDGALHSIKDLIENESVVWEKLQGYFNQLPKLETETEKMKKALWAVAVRSLFDACARAHKRELEKKGDN